MAAINFSALFLGLSVVVILFSPSHSLTCSKQNFTNSKLYTNCTDLPSLSAYFHWTYDSDKSSLSIAFIATPAKSDGWIAWAINPTGTGMVGAQSLIAFKQSNGSMTVDTYNISSYRSIVRSKLSFDVSGTTAEYSGGKMMIFATLALPDKTTKVNQVWQVGSSVTDGMPHMHEFQPANLNSKATLDLLKSAEDAPGTASSIAIASVTASSRAPRLIARGTASSPAPSPATSGLTPATPSPTAGGPIARGTASSPAPSPATPSPTAGEPIARGTASSPAPSPANPIPTAGGLIAPGTASSPAPSPTAGGPIAPGTASSPAPSPATPSPTAGGPIAPGKGGVSRISSNTKATFEI